MALEELMSKQEDHDKWREWPLVASDGDTAALLELVSEGKVSFHYPLYLATIFISQTIVG